MSSHVGVYLDQDGIVAKIVLPHFDEPNRILTDADFAAHDDPALTRITVSRAVYKSAAPPINNGGQPFYEDLCEKILPSPTIRSPSAVPSTS